VSCSRSVLSPTEPPSPALCSVENFCTRPAHPFASTSTADRVSFTGYSVFRNGDFVLARSRLVGSSCDSPRCVIEIRPTDFCHPTLCSTSTRTRLLPARRQDLRPAHTERLASVRTEESSVFTTPESLRGSPGLRGSIDPQFAITHLVRKLEATNSDTPVASLTSFALEQFLADARPVKAAKTVSTPPAVTRATLSRSKVPFLGK